MSSKQRVREKARQFGDAVERIRKEEAERRTRISRMEEHDARFRITPGVTIKQQTGETLPDVP